MKNKFKVQNEEEPKDTADGKTQSTSSDISSLILDQNSVQQQPVIKAEEETRSILSENLIEDEQMQVPVSEEKEDTKSSKSEQAENEEIKSDSSDSSSEILNQEPHASLAQQLASENSADERPRTPVEKILKSASEKLQNLKHKFRKSSKSESGKLKFKILIGKI